MPDVTVHDSAAMLVAQLAGEAGLPAASGLRISVHPEHRSLVMALAGGPVRSDRVVGRVFVSDGARSRLRGRCLTAQLAPGRSAFYFEG